MTSGRKVGTPDAASEQDITDDDAASGGHIETDAAIGMTGGVEHLKYLMPKTDDITFLDVAVGGGKIRPIAVHPEGGTVCNSMMVDAHSRLVHQQRYLERADTIAISQNVVNMGVCINNIFDFQLTIFQKIGKILAFDETAHSRINDYRLLRVIVKDDSVYLYLVESKNSGFQLVTHILLLY